MSIFRRFKTADGFIDYDTTKGMFTTWYGELAHKARYSLHAIERKYPELTQEQSAKLFLEALELKAINDELIEYTQGVKA